ncbi:hypothetical protein R6L23_00655 [Streptomyces sp. SR27]|nr:hypothetical protein [Streptomyces sp. SR27]MDV9186764.1 hypothetical protein [Streptomyces sp. SR27]
MSATALTRPLVTSLMEDAAMAPSMHNAQPWKFVCRTGAGVIETHHDHRVGGVHRAVHDPDLVGGGEDSTGCCPTRAMPWSWSASPPRGPGPGTWWTGPGR